MHNINMEVGVPYIQIDTPLQLILKERDEDRKAVKGIEMNGKKRNKERK
jgi:hypothetical protein